MKEMLIVMRKMVGLLKDETTIFVSLLKMFNDLKDMPEVRNNTELQEQVLQGILDLQQFMAIRQIIIDESNKTIEDHADDVLIIE